MAELKRIHAEGRAADVGARNPYYGQRVNAAVWRGGYRRMLDYMLANSPARQAYLRARAAVVDSRAPVRISTSRN